MAMFSIGDQDWLDKVQEEIVDPDLTIIDPHHHLWRHDNGNYLAQELHNDTQSGHRVEKTVYIQCGVQYRQDGPDHLKPLGEIEFVVEQGKETQRLGGPTIAGIVGRVDLQFGDGLEELIDQFVETSEGLFRGTRHNAARAGYPDSLSIASMAPEGLYEDSNFRNGLKVLGSKGFTYDAWHYHPQNPDFTALAKTVPDTVLVLDHFGTPLGVGPYATQRKEIFEQLRKDLVEMAKCENVYAKLGGLAMPDNGFGWESAPSPPTSDEVVDVHRDYFLLAIDCFGPERCMMESNFPVDRQSLSYAVLFNAMKKMTADFSVEDKKQLFRDTAQKVYRLG